MPSGINAQAQVRLVGSKYSDRDMKKFFLGGLVVGIVLLLLAAAGPQIYQHSITTNQLGTNFVWQPLTRRVILQGGSSFYIYDLAGNPNIILCTTNAPFAGAVLTADADGSARWKTNTASGGGDTVWTNDTSGGNQVLENIDQTSNLALLDYNAGNVLFSTFGGYYPLDGKNNTILGNTWPDASSQTNLVAIGNLAVNAMSASLSTVAIGNQPANAVTNDSQSIFIGTLN